MNLKISELLSCIPYTYVIWGELIMLSRLKFITTIARFYIFVSIIAVAI